MVVDRARTTYPTSEMQSAFLRTYTLNPVLDRFRCTKHPYGEGEGFGSAPVMALQRTIGSSITPS